MCALLCHSVLTQIQEWLRPSKMAQVDFSSTVFTALLCPPVDDLKYSRGACQQTLSAFLHTSEQLTYGINRIKGNTIAINAGILRDGYGQKVQFLPEGNGVIDTTQNMQSAMYTDASLTFPSLLHQWVEEKAKTFACHKCVSLSQLRGFRSFKKTHDEASHNSLNRGSGCVCEIVRGVSLSR